MHEDQESHKAPEAASGLNDGLGESVLIFATPVRTRSNTPVTFRLAKHKDGTLVLQGGFHWQEGWSAHGIDWEDLPTLGLDT
jgi:hypothetical protein